MLILISSANIVFISFNNIPAILEESACEFKNLLLDYPDGSVVNNLPCNVGTKDQSLVWEYSTCCGATNAMHQTY